MAKARLSERDKAIIAKTASHCHICGRGIDTDRDSFAFDHVVPRELGGSDDISNLLLACTKCNGLRWDHHPETLQRILFLGVIANYKGYKTPSSSAESQAIRSMRAQRLLRNMTKRTRLTTAERGKLIRPFKKFEDEIASRMQRRKAERRQLIKNGTKGAKDIKVRWTEVVDAALSAREREIPPRYKAAYRRLLRYEEPGPDEVETTKEAD